MITIKNLHFSYEEQPVFQGLNLIIPAGQFIAILGHNGSGKSTLSKLLVGLEEADSGEIYIDDMALTEENITEIRKKISIVFQNPDNQFVGSTVIDDIAFGLENQRVPRDEMIPIVENVISQVGLNGFEEKAPHELSGGQKQRTAIAGALAVSSQIILFDESTSMLDPSGREEIMALIQRLAADSNRTIILITHHLNEAVAADRVIVLNEGKITVDGTPEEAFIEFEELAAAHLDVPFVVKASKKLVDAGRIKDICLREEELVKALCM